MTSPRDAGQPPPCTREAVQEVLAVKGRPGYTTRRPSEPFVKPTSRGHRPAVVTPRPRPPADDAMEGPPDTEVWQLIRRAQAGDAGAFGSLYDRYKEVVFRFIYYRVNGHRQLAEDLTADTFMRAIKSLGSFTWQGRDLGAWLVTIARNLIADHFKASRTRLEVPTEDMRADVEAQTGRWHQDSPEALALARITNAALLEAIQQLSTEQQECIVLRFIQGFSVMETARAMDKSEGAVKALQYRGARTLRKLIPEGLRP